MAVGLGTRGGAGARGVAGCSYVELGAWGWGIELGAWGWGIELGALEWAGGRKGGGR